MGFFDNKTPQQSLEQRMDGLSAQMKQLQSTLDEMRLQAECRRAEAAESTRTEAVESARTEAVESARTEAVENARAEAVENVKTESAESLAAGHAEPAESLPKDITVAGVVDGTSAAPAEAELPRYKADEEWERKLDEKDLVIKKLHMQVEKLQENAVWNAQKTVLLQMIGIADNIRMILKKQSETPDHDVLLGDVRGLLEWVEADLADNGVSRYQDTLDDPRKFSPKRQTIAYTVPTDDENLLGTYATDQPGYEWQTPFVVIKSDAQLQNVMGDNKTPQTLGFVMRQEEVVKYCKE